MSDCPVCGASLEGHRPQARYCSAVCRAEAWRERNDVAGFWRRLARIRRNVSESRRKRSERFADAREEV